MTAETDWWLVDHVNQWNLNAVTPHPFTTVGTSNDIKSARWQHLCPGHLTFSFVQRKQSEDMSSIFIFSLPPELNIAPSQLSVFCPSEDRQVSPSGPTDSRILSQSTRCKLNMQQVHKTQLGRNTSLHNMNLPLWHMVVINTGYPPKTSSLSLATVHLLLWWKNYRILAACKVMMMGREREMGEKSIIGDAITGRDILINLLLSLHSPANNSRPHNVLLTRVVTYTQEIHIKCRLHQKPTGKQRLSWAGGKEIVKWALWLSWISFAYGDVSVTLIGIISSQRQRVIPESNSLLSVTVKALPGSPWIGVHWLTLWSFFQMKLASQI